MKRKGKHKSKPAYHTKPKYSNKHVLNRLIKSGRHTVGLHTPNVKHLKENNSAKYKVHWCLSWFVKISSKWCICFLVNFYYTMTTNMSHMFVSCTCSGNIDVSSSIYTRHVMLLSAATAAILFFSCLWREVVVTCK